jgi:hypothetical protein
MISEEDEWTEFVTNKIINGKNYDTKSMYSTEITL